MSTWKLAAACLGLIVSAPIYFVAWLAGHIAGAATRGFQVGWRIGPVLLLLIPLALAGCPGEQHDAWWGDAPTVLYEANGFTFGFHGPRGTGWAPDVSPSLELDLVKLDEIGARLEAQARALAARTGLDPELAVAELRRLPIRIVDDYSFEIQGRWACGMHWLGAIYTCLWLRTEAPSSEAIPLEAPGWTINPPDGANVNWRYGARPLVASADHELGHHFFGPNFEH